MLNYDDEMVDPLPSKSYLTNLKLDSIELLSNPPDLPTTGSIEDLTFNSPPDLSLNLNSFQTESTLLDKLISHPQGFQLLLDKLKESISSSKELSSYFKKQSSLESEYATGLGKLDFSIYKHLDSRVSQYRMDFAKELLGLSENVSILIKDTERSRKQLKDALAKYSREISDLDDKVSRAREKYETALEEWENFRTGGKELSKFGMFKQKLAMDLKILPRNEDEARIKVSQLNTLYNQLVQSSNSLHETYNKIHLPRVCGALLDALDNASQVTQKVLERYGEMKEKVVMGEATVISPLEGEGIMGISRGKEMKWNNFDSVVESESTKNSISLKAASPRNSLSLNAFGKSSIVFPNSNTLLQFGKSLEEITELTSSQVPVIVQNCIDYIQSTGLYQEGLYRISGNSQMITQLKFSLDQNANLPLEDVVKDIHSVTGVLKLFFREMREPLIPKDMFQEFTNAAKMDNDRLQLVKIHELVNSLDDLHYGTLKILAKHLSIVSLNQVKNKMTAANLGIVWGPNLMDSGVKVDATDLQYSSRVVEVIINNVDNLFEFDD